MRHLFTGYRRLAPLDPLSRHLIAELTPVSTQRNRPGPAPLCVALFLLAVLAVQPALLVAQDRPPYILGQRQGLEMIVHIIGEVQKPGEYRVPDSTNLLELVSKAGGPTEFSRLSDVTVRRTSSPEGLAGGAVATDPSRVEILHMNIERAMRDRQVSPLSLRPGDVVYVPKNSRQKWLDASTVVRDLSIIASSYFLYLRTRD